MKYLMFGLIVLNVYFAFQGYALNGFLAGFMLSDMMHLTLSKANA